MEEEEEEEVRRREVVQVSFTGTRWLYKLLHGATRDPGPPYRPRPLPQLHTSIPSPPPRPPSPTCSHRYRHLRTFVSTCRRFSFRQHVWNKLWRLLLLLLLFHWKTCRIIFSRKRKNRNRFFKMWTMCRLMVFFTFRWTLLLFYFIFGWSFVHEHLWTGIKLLWYCTAVKTLYSLRTKQ